MKKIITRLLTVVLMTLLVSCGDADYFIVKGEIDGNPTMNIRYLYYSNGRVNRGVTASREGKFEIRASAIDPTILEICDNDYRPMARLYVRDGDNIKCQLKRGRPYELKLSGSDVSGRWADALADNLESLTASPVRANAAIEDYIAAHPDDIVSTLLMLTSYDASHDAVRADSVMSSINQDSRPALLIDGFNALLQRLVDQSTSEKIITIPYFNRHDSLVDFRPADKPYSLIALSDASSHRYDSIVPALRRLNKSDKRLQILDLSLDIDTVTWHKSIAADTARWQQGWVVASIASPGVDRLGVPALPYFIVVDSAGTQQLRTRHIGDATRFLNTTK